MFRQFFVYSPGEHRGPPGQVTSPVCRNHGHMLLYAGPFPPLTGESPGTTGATHQPNAPYPLTLFQPLDRQDSIFACFLLFQNVIEKLNFVNLPKLNKNGDYTDPRRPGVPF